MNARQAALWNVRNTMAAIVLALNLAATACSNDPPPPPELIPPAAAAGILQRWSAEELNHFTVVFHSDTLIDCGVKNDLWKLTEMTDKTGYAWGTVYQLKDKGKKMLSAIDLKESGKGHSITLRGPYRFAITNITDPGVPTTRRVAFHWEIDWERTPEEMKACLPQFELSGNQVAKFDLAPDQTWKLTSYMTAEELAAAPSGVSVMEQIKH